MVMQRLYLLLVCPSMVLLISNLYLNEHILSLNFQRLILESPKFYGYHYWCSVEQFFLKYNPVAPHLLSGFVKYPIYMEFEDLSPSNLQQEAGMLLRRKNNIVVIRLPK